MLFTLIKQINKQKLYNMKLCETLTSQTDQAFGVIQFTYSANLWKIWP